MTRTTELFRCFAAAVLFTGMVVAVAGCQPQASEDATRTDSVSEAPVPGEMTEDTDMPSLAPGSADTLVYAWSGEPESLDPHWSYESQGLGIAANVYDGLVGFNRGQPDDFVPALATAWEISDDQTTYTFQIREGVTFHAGGSLEPHDVAYTLQRGLLQDRAGGPMWMYVGPLLGANSIESLAIEKAGLEAGGDEGPALADVPTETLAEVCDMVKAAVVADDEAGTVTVTLAAPTSWILQLLGAPEGGIMDQEWMVAQGDWDGACDNWVQWHNPAAEASILFDQANGTGPYALEGWKKGESITLVANDDYWRAEPAWAGGPSGPPAIKTVVIQKVAEWATRLVKLETGEADIVDIPRDQIIQVQDLVHTEYLGASEEAPATVLNPDGVLKLFRDYPTMRQEVAQFNFQINNEGGNDFIGSGQLDGQGIPPDFFSDVHVRKGFSYCFDWEPYIEDALQGEAVQSRGPVANGVQGFDEDSPVYERDLDKCEEELAQAWSGQLPETGFQLFVAYDEGSTERQIAGQILADGLSQVNPDYRVDVIKLEWPTLLDNMNQRRLPMAFAGWYEDYHDASNWVHPYMHSGSGAYALNQSFPSDMAAEFDSLVDEGIAETDPAAREAIFRKLQELAYENAIDLFLAQWLGRTYVHRSISGWFFSPLQPGFVYYNLSKDGS